VTAITAAEKVLIVADVLNLAYGALLDYPITAIRAKGIFAQRLRPEVISQPDRYSARLRSRPPHGSQRACHPLLRAVGCRRKPDQHGGLAWRPPSTAEFS
jgi:hypothetical protein